MASERMSWLALMALFTIIVYFLDGLVKAGVGGGMARGGVILAGIATAWWAPGVLRGLGRIKLRSPLLEEWRKELSLQSGAQPLARVLVERVQALTGASAVSLHLGDACMVAVPEPLDGEPSLLFPLAVQGRAIGAVRCHGKARNVRLVTRMLRVGAFALQNALLAERASAAERVRGQAQAQRDLQHRLTWTVTTQLCVLLDETRERLEAVRLCARALPADLLTRDLDGLSERLHQLEGFVQENLRNANIPATAISPLPLARSSRPK